MPERMLDAAVGLTMALTMAFPLIPEDKTLPVLGLIGLASALVVLKLGGILRRSPFVSCSGAMGLMLANLLLLPFIYFAPEPSMMASSVSLPLLILLQQPAQRVQTSLTGLGRYLPFILAFYLVSGLRYDMLQQSMIVPAGLGLGTYMLAVVGAAVLVRRDRDMVLALGIVFGMLSLSFDLFPSNPGYWASGISMQASAGCVDLFLLSLLLVQPDWFRAFAAGIAVMGLGIVGGEVMAGLLQDMHEVVTMAGYATLTVAVLALYWSGRQRGGYRTAHGVAERGDQLREWSAASLAPDHGLFGGKVPDDVSMLSAREKAVLKLVLEGSSYKQAGARLSISESSVKTYMRRVFEKLGVAGKQELLSKYGSVLIPSLGEERKSLSVGSKHGPGSNC